MMCQYNKELRISQSLHSPLRSEPSPGATAVPIATDRNACPVMTTNSAARNPTVRTLAPPSITRHRKSVTIVSPWQHRVGLRQNLVVQHLKHRNRGWPDSKDATVYGSAWVDASSCAPSTHRQGIPRGSPHEGQIRVPTSCARDRSSPISPGTHESVFVLICGHCDR